MFFHPFFFHPTEFLRGLNDGNPWKLLIFIFQMSANLSFTASKIIRHLVFQYSIDNEINLDNCVLVSCLLMSSVKKNNFLACSLNFSLILACCSVDYLSQTVHFCLHHNLLYAIYYSNFSSFLCRRDLFGRDRYFGRYQILFSWDKFYENIYGFTTK